VSAWRERGKKLNVAKGECRAINPKQKNKLDRNMRRKYFYMASDIAVTTNEQIWLYNESIDYLEGNGVPQDSEKSFALNAKAAHEGYRNAVLAMGWYYLGGVGVPQDYEKAKKWYKKSARHGEPKAMFSLGRIFYTHRDYSESFLWFNRAVEAGHARSLYWVGKHYWYGQSVVLNKKEAIRLFHLAANKNVIAAKRILKFLSRRELQNT
jgi:TPR repeat protein